MNLNFRIATLLIAGLLLTSLGLAQEKNTPKGQDKSFSGYLVDKNCGTMIGKKDKEKAMTMGKKHSVACALDEACMASGYGLVHEGEFLPFDDDGNSLAVTYLESLSKKNDVFVTVSARREGMVLHVSKISDEETSISKKW